MNLIGSVCGLRIRIRIRNNGVYRRMLERRNVIHFAAKFMQKLNFTQVVPTHVKENNEGRQRGEERVERGEREEG